MKIRKCRPATGEENVQKKKEKQTVPAKIEIGNTLLISKRRSKDEGGEHGEPGVGTINYPEAISMEKGRNSGVRMTGPIKKGGNQRE